MAIQICVPREVREGEQRVALVPDIVNRLAKAGLSINIQASAGELVGYTCLLYTSPSPRDKRQSRMPSSA